VDALHKKTKGVSSPLGVPTIHVQQRRSIPRLGAHRHPCPGVKVAKLEMKWVGAVFLMRCECELADIDEDGKFLNCLPVPNGNRLEVCMCLILEKVIQVDVNSLLPLSSSPPS
jgi:hypothetical protein